MISHLYNIDDRGTMFFGGEEESNGLPSAPAIEYLTSCTSYKVLTGDFYLLQKSPVDRVRAALKRNSITLMLIGILRN
jgi:hypothetical protein